MSKRIKEADKIAAKNILNRRLALGLSRAQLAERIGITHQQLHKYETAQNRVSCGMLTVLSKELNAPYHELLSKNYCYDSPKMRLAIEMSRAYALLPSRQQKAIYSLVKTLVGGDEDV